MSHSCNYCGYSTAQKYNLTKHQKTALYCLEIQEKNKDLAMERLKCQCEGCCKRFADTSHLNHHLKSCKQIKILEDSKKEVIEYKQVNINLKIELEKSLEREKMYKEQSLEREKMYKEQIQDLKAQLAEKEKSQKDITLTAITRPTTNVRQTIKNLQVNNLTPLLEHEMKAFVPQLTQEHIKDGAAGYARYALEYPLKDKITCTDISRKKLAWKDVEGTIVYDNEGSKLAEKFFRILTERNLKLFREIINDLGERSDAAYKREDLVEVDAIVELTNKIYTYRVEAIKTGKGDDTDLKNDFIKYLCIANKTTN